MIWMTVCDVTDNMLWRLNSKITVYFDESVLDTCIWIWIILLMEQLNEIWMIDELLKDGITVIWGVDSFILWCRWIVCRSNFEIDVNDKSFEN